MTFVLKDDATQQWIGSPADNRPTPGAGQTVVEVPGNFPAACSWVVKAGPTGALIGGFEDIAPPAPLMIAQFMLLFTQAERIALRAARANDPAVDDFWELMLGCTAGVSLDHPVVELGVQHLVSAGLLTADRATAILAGTPPAS